MKCRALVPLLFVLASSPLFADSGFLTGKVVVRSSADKVVVAIASYDPKQPPSDTVDHLFVYTLRQPLARDISFETDGAVTFTEKRLTLSSAEGGSITIGVAGSVREHGRKALLEQGTASSDDIRIGNGAGLAHYEHPTGLTLKGLATVGLQALTGQLIEDTSSCGSGGKGSSACSNGTCSVSCTSGYYSCCNSGSCTCI